MYEVGDMRMVAIHTSVMQVCFGIGIFAWSGELCDVTLPLLERLNLVCVLAGAPGKYLTSSSASVATVSPIGPCLHK